MNQKTALIANKYARQQLGKLHELTVLGDILSDMSPEQERAIAQALADGDAIVLLVRLQEMVLDYYVDQALESLPQLDEDQTNI